MRSGLAFTPGGQRVLASGDGDDCSLIREWDLESKKQTRVFKGHARYLRGLEVGVITLTLDREEKYLLSGGGGETVRIWDLASGKEIACLGGNKAIVRSIAVSEGNKYLVTCSDKLIRVWELQQILKSHTSGR